MNAELESRLLCLLNRFDRFLKDENSDSELGFKNNADRSVNVYIGESGGFPWYHLGDDEKQIPIEFDSLVGKIAFFQIREQVSQKYGASIKLTVGIVADKNYRITSGIDTVFSKSLISSLDNASVKSDDVLRLTVRVGDSSKVILLSTFKHKTGEMLKSEKLPDDVDMIALVENVAAKTGVKFQNKIASEKPSSTTVY